MPEPVETAYIHIPFCKSKCFYCDFISYANQESFIDEYFEALLREIEIVDNYYRNSRKNSRKPLKSVFFGGGTPSYVPSKHIVDVLNELRSRFEFANDVEITIECNPGTVDLQKFQDYKNAGVNRISIGLQSTSDVLLKQIGRIHNYEEFEKCIEYADQVGLTNRNVDIMFGLPSQTIEDVNKSIQLVLQKGVAHVSFYSLILEEGTPFYKKYNNFTELLPSEDLERDMYWKGVEEFQKNGFLHYEISNLAKPGYSCKQNIAYWKTKEYFGFGAGAHSYQQCERIENEIDIKAYINRILSFKGMSNAPGSTDKCELSPGDRELEYFMLGFRLLEGINTKEFEKIFSTDIKPYLPRLDGLVDKGYLVHINESYKLTKTGIDFANQVFMEFV